MKTLSIIMTVLVASVLLTSCLNEEKKVIVEKVTINKMANAINYRIRNIDEENYTIDTIAKNVSFTYNYGKLGKHLTIVSTQDSGKSIKIELPSLGITMQGNPKIGDDPKYGEITIKGIDSKDTLLNSVSLKEGLEDMTEYLRPSIKETAKDTKNDVGNYIKTAAKDVSNGVKTAAKDVGNGVSNAYNWVKGKIVPEKKIEAPASKKSISKPKTPKDSKTAPLADAKKK